MPSVRADIVQVHPYRVLDGRVEHLVLRRADDDELCPGAWQVITGGTSTNETSLDAAVRELREETALEARRWHVTGRVATFYFAPFDAVVLSPIIACEIDGSANVAISREHAASRWLVAAEARAILEFGSHRDGVTIVDDFVARLLQSE